MSPWGILGSVWTAELHKFCDAFWPLTPDLNIKEIWATKALIQAGSDWSSRSVVRGAWLANNTCQPYQHPFHDWMTQIWTFSVIGSISIFFQGKHSTLTAGNGVRCCVKYSLSKCICVLQWHLTSILYKWVKFCSLKSLTRELFDILLIQARGSSLLRMYL